ncbi:glycosyltransferase [Wenxinia saemankumensis]|uniref:Glycosyltransferase family 28 C-terminal domain-containing protein n=1 Tax=Wenxinia saemankumensis TaxID=1447782 RepID=A0A1M6ATV8_9RHOB|nr:glycosyltransferase [Wenxinia saemankumensis]SHI39959.1 Glycosyltransferase family 28 C-terminal domain-containing protein [Wenxinia saemankumensis]
MRDTIDLPGSPARPVGYFVHHQGRGHAERCAALVNALPEDRPVTIFCARDDIFPPLRRGARIERIPSLFERPEDAAEMDWVATPQTLHCAPLGWGSIRRAMATMTAWFDAADPALMISDVSAEVAQLARICSVPHVKVLQHGDRSDPGHRAAYDGAAGLLAPFHEALAQPGWDAAMRGKIHFAPGLGIDAGMPDAAAARARLGRTGDRPLALVVSGGGGNGVAEAPLGVAARTFPDMDWVVIGAVQRDWHATLPANLSLPGWVDNAADWIAAADLVVASTGNTTCHQVLAAGKPWLAVPEWRYFDEQIEKARALQAAGAATHLPHLPASAHAWQAAVARARADHDPHRQRALVAPRAAAETADWIEGLIGRLWRPAAAPSPRPDTAKAFEKELQ